MKSTKIIFESSFIAKNPFHAILGLQKIFEIFFQKNNEIFVCFDPPYFIGEKNEVNKKSLLSALS